MRYYIIIGRPQPVLKAAIPILETKGLFRCLGIIEDIGKSWQEILVAPPELAIINLDCWEQEIDQVIDKLKQFSDVPPEYIGITDCAESGFRAFKVGFKEVLLSPQNSNEIINTILKNLNFLNPSTDLICFNSFRDVFYLRPAEILFLKADDFTTDVYLTNGRIIGVLRTLKTFGSLLPPQFLRIQRSIIINTYYLYHVNDAKKRCSVLGAPSDFKYSNKYIPNKLLLQRWI